MSATLLENQLELIPTTDPAAPISAASQAGKILRYLQNGGALTALDALSKFECMRLAARIKDIRDAGYPVISEPVECHSKTYSRYRLQ